MLNNKMLRQQNGINSIFVLLLVIFTYVLSSVVISQNIRLHWWDKNVKTTNKESINNEPQDWATWLASIFIAITSIYVLYVIYQMYNKVKL